MSNLKPPVKWVGGKRKLAPAIVTRFPERVTGTYFEPFVGAAAVFCELWNAGRIVGPSVFVDHNDDLIELYRQMKSQPDLLIAELRRYEAEYQQGSAEATADLYYRVRTEWNAGQHTPARFVFLKQTAFNGLWRVNQQGKMNAAWGKYGHRTPQESMPAIVDEENIRNWHAVLQQVTLISGDALTLTSFTPGTGDAVYLDPPYVGTFDGYTDAGFSDAQQEQLLALAQQWTQRGAFVAYSNSTEAEEKVRRCWPVALVDFLSTSYTINRDASGRSGKRELLAVAQGAPVNLPVLNTLQMHRPSSLAPLIPGSDIVSIEVLLPDAVVQYDIAISPSQVETFDLCRRKWAYQKIDRMPSTTNAAAALGSEAHTQRENWLLHGTPPAETRAGKLARVGLEHLPPPGQAWVEIALRLLVTFSDGTRVLVNGRVDFFVHNLGAYVFGEAGIPVVGDHKTSSGEQWAKTSEDLLTKDSQSAIYATYALFLVPTAPAVDLHWSYMIKASSPRQLQVRVRMQREHALRRFSEVVSRAKDMLQLTRTPGIVASAVPPTASACEAYGGCPFRDICPISNQERIGALMSQGSLNDMLTARLNGGAPAAAAPQAPGMAGMLAAPAPLPMPAMPLSTMLPQTAPSAPSALLSMLQQQPPVAVAPQAPVAPVAPPPNVAAMFAPQAPIAPIAPIAPVAPPAPVALTYDQQVAAYNQQQAAFAAQQAAQQQAAQQQAAQQQAFNEQQAALAAQQAAQVAQQAAFAAFQAQQQQAQVQQPYSPTPGVVVSNMPAPQGAVGVVPPDAPKPDPALTLEEAKAMEKAAKKGGRPAKKGDESDEMITLITRIAVALEAIAAKGA